MWDSFSEEQRRNYILRKLTPGRVIHLNCPFASKEKFLVVASINPDPLFFVINTSVNKFVQERDYLAKCQVSIDQVSHEFLDHNSFVAAHEIIDSIGLEETYHQLLANRSRIKAEISADVRNEIIAAVKFSVTISAEHKNQILAVFEE